MKTIQRSYLVPIILVVLGVALIWVSSARADAWEEAAGLQFLKQNCINQMQTCFTSPDCTACTTNANGQNGWLSCGGAPYSSCKEIANVKTGICDGTEGTGFLCRDSRTCALVEDYPLPGCAGTPTCTWKAWRNGGVCLP